MASPTNFNLRLHEASVLFRYLNDPDAVVALKAFFWSEAARCTDAAVRALTARDERTAIEAAFKATAYQEAFTNLQLFCKEQIEKASA